MYACTLTSGPVPVLDVLRVVLATGVYWHEQLLNIQRDTPRFENSPPDHHIAVVGTCVHHTKRIMKSDWSRKGMSRNRASFYPAAPDGSSWWYHVDERRGFLLLKRLVGSMQGQVLMPSDHLALPVRLFDHHSIIPKQTRQPTSRD